jgi:glycosyltransferase involved in cell wall biosynthesis
VSFSFGFLSTYPPTQCGLATFTESLATHLVAAGNAAGVVRMVDKPEALPSVDVVHHLVRGARGASSAAAMAMAGFDVVVVQHEFGIYGGLDGEDLLLVLDQLHMPVVVVAHTVLTTPTRHQREVLERVIHRADAIVTMTMTARNRLLACYRVEPGKVVVIPHGASTAPLGTASLPHGAPSPGNMTQVGTGKAPTILTWGLLGPGKGIEFVIDALPGLRSLDRPPHYQVVGQTHPKVLERDGEAYRSTLMAQAADRGVSDMVSFHGSYLDTASLNQIVAQADVVVLPYESREQVTSGVLIEAVASGTPVVATAFPHAVELLASGAGLVVPHNDPAALLHALRRVLVEPGLAASMAGRSSAVAAQLQWSAVAARYQDLADGLVAANAAMAA